MCSYFVHKAYSLLPNNCSYFVSFFNWKVIYHHQLHETSDVVAFHVSFPLSVSQQAWLRTCLFFNYDVRLSVVCEFDNSQCCHPYTLLYTFASYDLSQLHIIFVNLECKCNELSFKI